MTAQARLGWWMVGTVAVLTVIRLLVAGASELFPAEAYYWTYSLHPAWGYHDHPPFVAWVAAAGTRWLGNTELGVRVGSVLLHVATCAALWGTTRLWFGPRPAHWSVLIFGLLPVSGTLGLMLLPDAPLLCCWALMMLTVSLAVRQNGWWWLLAGVAFGGALLAKYPAAMLAPSLICFLMLAPAHRYWLRRAGPWVALAIGFAIFSPVVFWNAAQDWVSFRFQLSRAEGGAGASWVHAGLFWMQQLVVLSPLVFLFFVLVGARAIKRGWMCGEAGWALVGSFGLPVFALFALASTTAESRPNWTAPAFLALSVGAGALLEANLGITQLLRRRRWQRLTATGLGLCAIMVLTGYSVISLGQPWFLGSNRIGGWRELTAEVEAMRRGLRQPGGPEPFILGMDRYHLAASIGFYVRRPELTVNWYLIGEPGLSYRQWSSPAKWDHRPAVAVLRWGADKELRLLGHHCTGLGPPRTVTFRSASWRPRRYWLVPCRDFHFAMHPLATPVQAQP